MIWYRQQSENITYIVTQDLTLWQTLPVVLLKDTPSGLRQFSPTESPLKMRKNAFYFTLKTLFVLEIFIFLSWRFDHAQRQLDYKHQVNLIIYYIATWETNNCNTHIPNIPRSKGNQTMKFCQLKEYNMRNILLEKSLKKSSGETISRPFSEKPKLSKSLNQQSKRLYS